MSVNTVDKTAVFFIYLLYQLTDVWLEGLAGRAGHHVISHVVAYNSAATGTSLDTTTTCKRSISAYYYFAEIIVIIIISPNNQQQQSLPTFTPPPPQKKDTKALNSQKSRTYISIASDTI